MRDGAPNITAPILVALVLWVFGCSQSGQTQVQQQAGPILSARIYVEGTYRGNTPATVSVRRSFNETWVILRMGSVAVRIFEVELHRTGDSAVLPFTFGNDRVEARVIYNVEDLPVRNDSIHVVPYAAPRAEIIDRQYGLNLIVED